MEIQSLGMVLGLGLWVKSPGRGSGLLLRKGCAGVNGLRGDDGSVGVTGEVPFSSGVSRASVWAMQWKVRLCPWWSAI